MESKYEKTPARRYIHLLLGVPLIGFGLITLLGLISRFVTNSFSLPLSSYLGATLFGCVLPIGIGLLLIIQGFRKRT